MRKKMIEKRGMNKYEAWARVKWLNLRKKIKN